MQAKNTLQIVFTNLCSKYSDNKRVIDELWFEIKKYYSEKTRFYHTIEHIFDIYVNLFKARAEIIDFEIVLMTMFYHDIIYNPQKTDNEEQSAVFMQKSLQKINFPIQKTELCKFQILATKTHLSNDNDTNIFLDADLAILGTKPENYRQYTLQIRQEYSFFSDQDYKKGREGVLRHFLEMDRIYKTDFFHKKYENQAKLNINQELKILV